MFAWLRIRQDECSVEYGVSLGVGGIRKKGRMRNHLKTYGTTSFAYLLDLRFLLFLFRLKGGSTQ